MNYGYMLAKSKTIRKKSVEMEQMRHVWKDSISISPTVAKRNQFC